LEHIHNFLGCPSVLSTKCYLVVSDTLLFIHDPNPFPCLECFSTTNLLKYITSSYHISFDVIATASPLVLSEIKKQPLRPFGVGSPAYHIADYGTADAGTSLGLMSSMVEAVRERAGDEKKEVVVHYEDQLT